MDKPIQLRQQAGWEMTKDDRDFAPLVERALRFVYENPGKRMILVRPMLALEPLQQSEVLVSTIQDGLKLNPNIASR